MGLNAFIQGFVTIAIAVIGLYFSWESRRADNYQAVADLALSSDRNVAATAAETMELMTVDCRGDAATNLQEQRLRDIFCPLSTHHRFILTNMIDAVREAEKAEMLAALVEEEAAAAATPEPDPVTDTEVTDEEPSDTVADASGDDAPAEETSSDGYSDILPQINDRSRGVRRTAVAQLERNSLSDPRFIDALIDQLENPGPGPVGDLSVQGRYNVIYLLNQAPPSVWQSEERVARCLAAIETVYERERAGETSIGDQTRVELYDLKTRLEARQARNASTS